MDIKVNWEHKRVKHALERMWLRGVSVKDVINAIQRGKKIKQKKSGLAESFYSYYSIVYAEYVFKRQNVHKIYPVTVKIW